jgi:hypothetical protein
VANEAGYRRYGMHDLIRYRARTQAEGGNSIEQNETALDWLVNGPDRTRAKDSHGVIPVASRGRTGIGDRPAVPGMTRDVRQQVQSRRQAAFFERGLPVITAKFFRLRAARTPKTCCRSRPVSEAMAALVFSSDVRVS